MRAFFVACDKPQAPSVNGQEFFELEAECRLPTTHASQRNESRSDKPPNGLTYRPERSAEAAAGVSGSDGAHIVQLRFTFGYGKAFSSTFAVA